MLTDTAAPATVYHCYVLLMATDNVAILQCCGVYVLQEVLQVPAAGADDQEQQAGSEEEDESSEEGCK